MKIERFSVRAVAAFTLAFLSAVPAVTLAASWRPRLGIEGGPNLGRTNKVDAIGEDVSWTVGGSAGLVARWDFGSMLALEAVPGWERPVAHGEASITLNGLTMSTFEQTIRFDRVAMPVRAVFRPGSSAWSIEGGLSPSWLAHAGRSSIQTLSASTSVSMARPRAEPTANIFEGIGTFESQDWTSNFHRWDVAAVAGAGWDHRLAGHVFRARLRWQQGLTNVGKFDDPIRVSAASAQVGLLW